MNGQVVFHGIKASKIQPIMVNDIFLSDYPRFSMSLSVAFIKLTIDSKEEPQVRETNNAFTKLAFEASEIKGADFEAEFDLERSSRLPVLFITRQRERSFRDGLR